MSSTEQSLDEDFLVQFDYSFRYGDSKQVHFINTFDWFMKVSCHPTLMKMIIHDNWKKVKLITMQQVLTCNCNIGFKTTTCTECQLYNKLRFVILKIL